MANKIEIPLSNGYKLVAEQNPDGQYSRELFVDIENPSGACCQHLAIIRSAYNYQNGQPVWNDRLFEILVNTNPNTETPVERFLIDRRNDDGNTET